jgi:hypothetical protein
LKADTLFGYAREDPTLAPFLEDIMEFAKFMVKSAIMNELAEEYEYYITRGFGMSKSRFIQRWSSYVSRRGREMNHPELQPFIDDLASVYEKFLNNKKVHYLYTSVSKAIYGVLRNALYPDELEGDLHNLDERVKDFKDHIMERLAFEKEAIGSQQYRKIIDVTKLSFSNIIPQMDGAFQEEFMMNAPDYEDIPKPYAKHYDRYRKIVKKVIKDLQPLEKAVKKAILDQPDKKASSSSSKKASSSSKRSPMSTRSSTKKRKVDSAGAAGPSQR